MKKRVISLLLAMLLLVSMVQPAYAVDVPEAAVEQPATEVPAEDAAPGEEAPPAQQAEELAQDETPPAVDSDVPVEEPLRLMSSPVLSINAADSATADVSKKLLFGEEPSNSGAIRYTVVVLDTSGSMGSAAMSAQKSAAIKFCDSMFQASGENHIAIVKLNNGNATTVLQGFTQDLDTLKAKINGISASGGTDTDHALTVANNLLDEITVAGAQKSIVLCSDGLPEHSTTTTNGPYTSSDNTYYQQANSCYNTATAIKEKGYTIYSLGFFHNISSSYRAFAERFMQDLASEDKYYNVSNADALSFSFGQIADELLTIAEGSCGTNVTWTLRATGVLTISGTGEMKHNDSASKVPWYQKCSSITSVVIENGVTSISNYAFCNCSSLTSINIPGSVTSIGSAAFYGCSSLTSITIPASVTSIGTQVFYNCSSLTSINIPGSVTSIGSYAFQNCSSLTSINIPASVTSIENNAFYNCSSLASINIPASVTSIGNYAFQNCSSLTSINIPASVTSIGSSAFSGCSSLTSINIPEGVTSIGGSAFYSCRNLTSINIPDSVTSIGGSAFSGCSSLTSINIPEGVTSIGSDAFRNCSSLTSINIPGSVTSIGSSAFSGCSSLTSINIPEGVTSIGSYAFNNCTSLKDVHISDLAKWCGIPFADVYANPLYYAHTLYLNDEKVTNLSIPDGVTSIGNYAFYNCSSLTSINIPASVTSIGSYAFYYCSSLTSINIPEGVTSIGSAAFYNCSSLTSINIPEGVTSIGDSTFYNCSSLTSINIPEGVTSIGSYAFYNCSSLTSINIPDSVTSIGSSAFYNCSSLTSVTFGTGLKNLYGYSSGSVNNAFYGCSKLETMIFTGTTVPIINSSTTATSSNTNYIKAFFSASLKSLRTIWVPTDAQDAYSAAWGSYLPATVSIASNFSNGIIIPLTQGSKSSHTIRFSWAEMPIADFYRVYRDGKCLAEIKQTSYADTGLEPDSSHIYTVTACSGEQETERNEYNFATISPKVSSVSTAVSGNSTYFMDATHNVLYARVPNSGNLVGGTGKFTVNGQVLEAKANIQSTYADYSATWSITPQTVPEGKYTVIFTFTDADGETASQSAEIEVSYLIPSPIRDVAAIGDTKQVTVSWTISAEALTTTYLIYRAEGDGAFKLVSTIKNRNTFSYVDKNVTENSTYRYYVLGQTALGVTSIADNATIVQATAQADSEKPRVTEIIPEDQSRVGGGKAVTVTVRAEDNIGVAGICLYRLDKFNDDASKWHLLSESNSSTLTTSLSFTDYADGEIFLKAVAKDKAGNESDPLTRILVVDNSGPAQVTEVSCVKVQSTIITLKWKDVSDKDRSYFEVEQQNKDGSWELVKTESETSGTNIEELVPNTEYIFHVVAYDDVGNRGTPSNSITVRTAKDTSVPRVTNLSPSSTYVNNDISFSVTAEDDYGIKEIQIQTSRDLKTWENYGAAQTYTSPSASVTYKKTVSVAGMKEGHLYVRAVVKDFYGNVSDTSDTAPLRDYFLDFTPPAAPVGLTAQGAEASITLTWEPNTEIDFGSYQVYRSENSGSFTLINDVGNATKVIDQNVKSTAEYTYYVTAKDTVGNVSEKSAMVTNKAGADTIAPVINGVYPSAGATVGPVVEDFILNVSDNWLVKHITVSYTVNNGNSQAYIDEDVNAVKHSISEAFPFEAVHDGDRITFNIQVTDQCNLSATQAVTYTIDLTPPTLTNLKATLVGDKVEISWTGDGAKDLAGYKVYREYDGKKIAFATKAPVAGQTQYTCTDNNPKSCKAVTYVVEAEDHYGNIQAFETKNTVAYQPIIAALNCESVMLKDTEYEIDASASQMVDTTATYYFDFGDGTTPISSSDAKVTHKYNTPGQYTIKLTVTDSQGNCSEATKTVTVCNEFTTAEAKIKVVDASGSPISGAEVFFDVDKGSDNCKKTNYLGEVTFIAEKGNHVIGVFNGSDYIPITQTISVISGVDRTYKITLVNENMVTGTIETERMSLEEVEALHIDVSDSASREFLTVTVELMFGEKEVDFIIVRDGDGHSFTNFNYLEVVRNFKDKEEIVILKPEVTDVIVDDQGVPVATMVSILEIPLSASYTKEFFNVKLHLLNQAAENIELTDNVVDLNVPQGLTVMSSDLISGDTHVTFDSLKGQELKTIEWVVRGDQKGVYDLTADYAGYAPLFGRNVEAHFKTSQPIKVYGNDALKMILDVQKNIVGNTLTLNVGMQNVTTDAPIYNPSVDLSQEMIRVAMADVYADGMIKIDPKKWDFYVNQTGSYVVDAEGQKTDIADVGVINPGETWYKSYVINLTGENFFKYSKYLQAALREYPNGDHNFELELITHDATPEQIKKGEDFVFEPDKTSDVTEDDQQKKVDDLIQDFEESKYDNTGIDESTDIEKNEDGKSVVEELAEEIGNNASVEEDGTIKIEGQTYTVGRRVYVEVKKAGLKGGKNPMIHLMVFDVKPNAYLHNGHDLYSVDIPDTAVTGPITFRLPVDKDVPTGVVAKINHDGLELKDKEYVVEEDEQGNKYIEVTTNHFSPFSYELDLSIAQIGDNKYDSLSAAAAASKAGDTITLVRDTDEDIVLPYGAIFMTNGFKVGNVTAPGKDADGTTYELIKADSDDGMIYSVKMIPGHIHTWKYTDNGDGTHTAICTGCTETGATTLHIYKDSKCTACGAAQPEGNKYTVECYIDGKTQEAKEYKLDDIVTLTAPATLSEKRDEGTENELTVTKNFSHWAKDSETGIKVSTSNTYKFLAKQSVVLYAVYTTNAVVPTGEPVISITSTYGEGNGATNNVCFTASRSVPAGYTVIETGIRFATNKNLGYNSDNTYDLTSKDSEYDVKALLISNRTGKVKTTVSSSKANNGDHTMKFNVGTNVAAYVYALPYVLVRNSNGNQQTVYAEKAVAMTYESLTAPTIAITRQFKDGTKVCFTASRSVASNYQVVETGIKFATNKNLGYSSGNTHNLMDAQYGKDVKALLISNSSGKVKTSTSSSFANNGDHTLKFDVSTNNTAYVYAISFVTVKDVNGAVKTYYSDVIAVTLNTLK